MSEIWTEALQIVALSAIARELLATVFGALRAHGVGPAFGRAVAVAAFVVAALRVTPSFSALARAGMFRAWRRRSGCCVRLFAVGSFGGKLGRGRGDIERIVLFGERLDRNTIGVECIGEKRLAQRIG